MIYRHENGERVRPVPGGAEAERLETSDDWKGRPAPERPAEKISADAPARHAVTRGTARLNVGGTEKKEATK